MLVVTTTVGMVHGVHSHTSHPRESRALSLELVEQDTRLHDRLLVTTTTSNDTHSRTAKPRNGLSGARGKPDPCLSAVVGVTDNGGISARTPGVGALVTNRTFNVADGGTL